MTASRIHPACFAGLILVALTARVAAAAPSITITSPADGTTTTNPTIQVSATIDDAALDHVRVTCDGRSVSIHDGAVRCTIALHAGVNAIEVRAVAANGESASAAFRVSRKTSAGVMLVPSAVAIAMNGGRPGIIAAFTSSGHAATDVAWSVADPRKLMLEPYNAAATLTATSPGHTMISARSHSRIANAHVAVVETTSFLRASPPGTRNWAVGPIPGLRQRPPLNAVSIVHSPPSDDESIVVVEEEGCDLFAVDADPAGRFAVVRGLTNNGNLVWLGRIPGTPLTGDVFGGLLALVGPIGKPSKVLGRFDRADASAGIWRFYADGVIEDVAQSEDGTIYLAENLKPGRRISVIDGKSGLLKRRLSPGTGSTLGPLVGAEDDSALVEIRNALGLSLVRVTPTGIETIAHLSGADERPSDIDVGPAVRTTNGDTIAFWNDRAELHLSRVNGASVAAEFTLSHVRRRSTWQVLIDAFEAPWVYVSDGVSLEAIDLQRGEKLWQRHTSAVPFEAVADRHVIVSDPARHRVMELDDHGNTVLTMGATVTDARIIVQGNGIFHGFDPVTRSVVEISEPDYRESGWFSSLSFTTN